MCVSVVGLSWIGMCSSYCLPVCLATLIQAFDEHLNMVLGDVEESHTISDTDAETGETIVKVKYF